MSIVVKDLDGTKTVLLLKIYMYWSKIAYLNTRTAYIIHQNVQFFTVILEFTNILFEVDNQVSLKTCMFHKWLVLCILLI